ncbi:MAG: hypothetical protein IGS48_05445 [Oscillatoriales cyanobacterium C42_A2020_001]|nr:hypothetical protein [Leptolyngbyaceae cyanobacterium C42_A2020_001]
MTPLFPLAPRYRLDDELPWLEGIDPSRHYWLMVNGDAALTVAIPGLAVFSQEEFKQAILGFRALQPGGQMEIQRAANRCVIICISQNCYALEAEVLGATVWHLFDQETLESLLRTSHPDWKCAPKDVELGRRSLLRSWAQSIAA